MKNSQIFPIFGQIFTGTNTDSEKSKFVLYSPLMAASYFLNTFAGL